MPGVRWARSTRRISCSMSRSSLMPASSSPIADVHALGGEAVERGHARAQAEVGAAVVADAGAGLGHAGDVALVQPDTVAERHALVHQAEAVEVFDRRAAAALLRVGLLVRRFDQVHVHRHVVVRGRVGRAGSAPRREHQCRLAGASWTLTRSLPAWAPCRLPNRSMQPSSVIWKRSNQACIGPRSSVGSEATNAASSWYTSRFWSRTA